MNAKDIERHARYLTRARTGIRATSDAFELDFARTMWLGSKGFDALPLADKEQLRECWEDQRRKLLAKAMPAGMAG